MSQPQTPTAQSVGEAPAQRPVSAPPKIVVAPGSKRPKVVQFKGGSSPQGSAPPPPPLPPPASTGSSRAGTPSVKPSTPASSQPSQPSPLVFAAPVAPPPPPASALPMQPASGPDGPSMHELRTMNDQLESALSALVQQSRYVRNHVVVHTHRQLRSVRTDLDALRQDALEWQAECQQGFAEVESAIVAACENSDDLNAPEALLEERDRSAQAEMEVAELRARLRDTEAERDTLEMRLNDARSGFEVRAAQLKEAHREREATLEQQLRLLSASSARVEAMLLGRSATMDPFVPSAAAEISSPPRARAPEPTAMHPFDPTDLDTSSASAQWALKELRERRNEARRLATERARVPVSHWTETGHVESPATEVVKKPKKKKAGTTTKKKSASVAAANAPPSSHWR